MPENRERNGNGSRRSARPQGTERSGSQQSGARTRQPADRTAAAQRAPRQGQPRPANANAPRRRTAPRRAPEPEPEINFGEVIRGIIAVALTCMIVCMIVIMFAKTLFVSDSDLQKTAKTGHLTETQFEALEPLQQYTREEVVTTKATKKKKKTSAETEAPQEETEALPEGVGDANAGDYIVNSAVYLHPTPDANSANLATLPYGVTVKVLGSTYGWYYLEYEGQKGYAWGTYFTKAG